MAIINKVPDIRVREIEESLRDSWIRQYQKWAQTDRGAAIWIFNHVKEENKTSFIRGFSVGVVTTTTTSIIAVILLIIWWL